MKDTLWQVFSPICSIEVRFLAKAARFLETYTNRMFPNRTSTIWLIDARDNSGRECTRGFYTD